VDRSADVLWIGMGALFLGSSDFVQLCWVSAKGCHVRLIMSTCMSCVSGSSYRMYIDSNHRDSQI
jgi:hypothetical protein